MKTLFCLSGCRQRFIRSGTISTTRASHTNVARDEYLRTKRRLRCFVAPNFSPKIEQGLSEVGAFLESLGRFFRLCEPAVLLGTLGSEAQMGALE